MKLKYRKKIPQKQGRILERGGGFFWLDRMYAPVLPEANRCKNQRLWKLKDSLQDAFTSGQIHGFPLNYKEKL